MDQRKRLKENLKERKKKESAREKRKIDGGIEKKTTLYWLDRPDLWGTQD